MRFEQQLVSAVVLLNRELFGENRLDQIPESVQEAVAKAWRTGRVQKGEGVEILEYVKELEPETSVQQQVVDRLIEILESRLRGEVLPSRK